MADRVRTVDYYYVKVGNRPGEGRRLLEHLSEKGANLVAFTSFPVSESESQLDFVPDNAERLKEAARDAGVPLVGPKQAFLIQGDDRIGVLHEHHLKLANAGVNVVAANGACDGRGRYGFILWVKPEEFEKAYAALSG
jgi:hypothetical protein